MRPAWLIGTARHSTPRTSKLIGVLQEHAKERPRRKKGGYNRRVAWAFARWYHQQNPPVCRWARFAPVDLGHGRGMQRRGPARAATRCHQCTPSRARAPSQKADLSACGPCLWRAPLSGADPAARDDVYRSPRPSRFAVADKPFWFTITGRLRSKRAWFTSGRNLACLSVQQQ